MADVKDRVGYALTPELLTPDDCPDAFKGKTFYIFVDPQRGFRVMWLEAPPVAESTERAW